MSQTHTVKQVAEILGYSTNSIYTFLKEKRIKGIRVGKGRFRIPQEELNRILHLSKASRSPVLIENQTDKILAAPNNESVTNSLYDGLPILHDIQESSHIEPPSLFDWFLSVASILLGTSMLLFSRLLQDIDIKPFLPLLDPIQVSFIAAGLGILLTNTSHGISLSWHKLFHLILFAAYAVFALVRWQVADIEGGITVILLSFFAFLTTFLKHRGSFSFGLFAFSHGLAIPAAIMLNLPLTLPPFLQFIAEKPQIAGTLWFSGMLIISILGVWSYRQKNALFPIFMVITAPILIALSLWFANMLSWQKATLFLVMGLTCLLVPNWEQVRLWHKHERRIVFAFFTGILTLFLTTLGIIWITQKNITEFAHQELTQKVSYAKALVDETIDSIETTLVGTSKNPLLLTAVKEKNKEELAKILHFTYEGNRQMKRVFVLAENGDFLANYPFTALTASNFADREYFIKPSSTKKPYFSDGFESRKENRELIVTIAIPILSQEGSVAGVLTGIIDLDSLSDKLQKIANPQTEEYFVLIDSKARRLIYPDRTLIGKEIEIDNSLRQAVAGEKGLNEGYSYKGIRMFQSYNKISKANWGIGLQTPISEVLSPTRIISIVMFLMVSICTLVMGLFLFVTRKERIGQLQEVPAKPIKLPDTS